MATGVANALRQFRQLTIGKEVTYGTAVAQTRKLRIIDLRWNNLGNQRTYTPDYSIGRLTRRTDVPTVTRTGLADSSYTTDLSVEDVLFPLLAGFKGGVVAGTELTASQNDRPWIFQNDPNTGDPLPDSYTIGRRLSNGASNWDQRAPGSLVESFEISADQDGDASKITVNFWSRATDTTAISTLSLPTPFNIIPALKWTIGFDDTWGAMDTFGVAPSWGVGADVSTTIRSFTFRYHTGISPALFIGDGRIDPSKHRFLPRGAELEFTIEGNSGFLDGSSGEIAKAAAGTKRYIRLLGEGDRIGTGFNESVMIQGAYIYPDGGFGEIGGSTDGAETINVKLESLPDDDTEDVEIRVINTLSAFPS